jgi:hypothetical protein
MARETTLRQVMAAAAGMAPVAGLTTPTFSWAAITRLSVMGQAAVARDRGVNHLQKFGPARLPSSIHTA